MKRASSSVRPGQPAHRQGFTLVELLAVITIIGILAAMLLPALSAGEARARRIECLGNLNELGVAFHLFAHDHGSRFPMQVPVSEGGSLEFARNGLLLGGQFYFSFRQFQPLGTQLGAPKLLVCPADRSRWPAANFQVLQNSNLSYFVGVGADYQRPADVLAGDRNLTNDDSAGAVTVLSSDRRLRWTGELHSFKGNVLFADGHAEELNQLPGDLAGNAGDLFLPSLPAPSPSNAGSGPAFPGATAGAPGQVPQNNPPEPGGSPPGGNPGVTALSGGAFRPAAAAPEVSTAKTSPSKRSGPAMASAAAPGAASAATPPLIAQANRTSPAPTPSWLWLLALIWLLALGLLAALWLQFAWRERRGREPDSMR